MRAQNTISFDGIGVINNRGNSKYWGVAVNPNPGGAKWRVQLNYGNGSKNISSFYFDGCNPTEQVAASIISKFYDLRDTGFKNPRFVKASDNKWYKVDPNSRKIRLYTSTSPIPIGMIKDLPTQFHPQRDLDLSPKTQEILESSLNAYEYELMNKLLDGFKTDKLSSKGIELMTKALDIMNR